MELNFSNNNNELLVVVKGRIDSSSATEFQEQVDSKINGVTKLILDFSNVEYVSSAGLRAVLFLKKKISDNNEVCIRNISDTVKEVFDLTGFSDFLIFE